MKNIENKIVLYTDKNGKVELRADVEKDTLWATQEQIAQIFLSTKQNIGLHLKNIFNTSELIRDSVVKDFFTTARDGKKYKVKFYNLDAIIAVGYRVNSKEATKFRIWATTILREYLIKGYNLNRHKLIKEGYNVEGLHEVVDFLESNKNDGPLKGKITFKLTKHLTSK